MKSVLTLDVLADSFVNLRHIPDGTNRIQLELEGVPPFSLNPRIELYKAEEFKGTAGVDKSGYVDLPVELYSDGHIFHFRFVTDSRSNQFYHILGDIDACKDSYIERKSGTLFYILDTQENEDVQKDYLNLLMKILTGKGVAAAEKVCYEQASERYYELAAILSERGIDTSAAGNLEALIEKVNNLNEAVVPVAGIIKELDKKIWIGVKE